MVDRRTLARSSPAGLAWWHSGGSDGESLWVPAPHLRLLSQKIVEVATGQLPRLIVTMPPRHGKSELISRFSPAWFLGRFPEKKVILVGYNDTFASSWGRKARDVLKAEQSLFGVRLNSETSGGGQWELLPGRSNRAGVMVTSGIGGGITGKGADLMIIDDPVKNAEEARSETTQAAHYDWWLSTARTRLMPGAGVILVMTRWHENDLAGQLLANDPARDDKGRLLPPGVTRADMGLDEVEGDSWEVLNMPAFAEAPEPVLPPELAAEDADPAEVERFQVAFRDGWRDEIGRAHGDVLWAEGGYDAEWMEQTRRALGSYWFTALYMQKPSPDEGMLFKRANFLSYDRVGVTKDGSHLVTIYPRDGEPRVFDTAYGTWFQTVDVAGSEKEQADFTVVSTWVVTPERDLLWWDCRWAKFDANRVGGFIRQEIDRYSVGFVGIERLGFGLAVIQTLVREGYPIVRLEPDADKVARALPACARYEAGAVFHPLSAPWLEDAEAQLLAFPNDAHDDIVDTVSYAALQLPHARGGKMRGGRVGVPSARGAVAGAPARVARVARGRGGTVAGNLLSRPT